MINPIQLENAYKEFSEDFSKWIPDGLIQVNLQFLQEMGILAQAEDPSSTNSLTHQFHVIETHDKVTLFNEQFAIWIVPQTQTELASTMILIALLQKKKRPHLEIVYTTAGVYNTPKYILKVLQHFLADVIDTEETLAMIHKKKGK